MKIKTVEKRKIKLKTINLFKNIVKIMSPPPTLTVSQWADRYRKLSPESSAEPGQWRTERAPYQRAMMDAVNDPEVETVVIMTSAQVGKALDIKTPIPTPNGWKSMGELSVGDFVFDENGKPIEIVFTSPIFEGRKCFEITFSDGTKIVADAEHKWYVQSETAIVPGVQWHGRGQYDGILTTMEIWKSFKLGKKRNRYAIPVAKQLQLPDAELPIHPYLLGVWLGDGNSHSAQLTLHKNDIEIVNYIKKLGYKTVIRQKDNRNSNIINVQINPYEKYKDSYCIRGHDMDIMGRTKNGVCAECSRQHALKSKWKNPNYLDPIINKPLTLHSILQEMNLLKNKHIPPIYLRASINQRMELIQGLMDTDGYVSSNGRAEFTTSSYELAEGFGELLHSLGIKHTKKLKFTLATNGKSKHKGKAYRFSFLVYQDKPIFKLKRKLERLKTREGCRVTETERRRIINVKEVASRPTRCVAVNSSSHLYLAGKQMVPTHNTEINLNIIGYFIDYDPAPLMLLMPTLELAQSFSKKRLATMIRDTPALRDKVKDPRTRDSDNTLLEKGFPGGYIAIVGANSAASLSSRPIRVLLADEVDRFPHSAGSEGDPLSLAEKRTKTFWNKKKIFVSTPTEKGISRIEAEYIESSMEEWCVPCPLCRRYQPYTWAQIKFEDVTMECKFCKERFSEHEWKAEEGKWIARNDNPSKRGFHLNALASPWERWENIIREFKDAKDKGKETLKVWVNTYLGVSWEDQDGEIADEEMLLRRRERYNCQLPQGVLVLTAGVDVQDDRIEVEVVGWGVGKENWGIEYKVFYGDPGQDSLWNQLDEYLNSEWYYANGDKLCLSCTCIDSGGHFTTEVYRFCKDKEHKRIFAIKGYGGAGKPFIGKASRNNREKVALFPLGVDTGKELIISRLKVEFEGQPGYCHYPIEQEKGYNSEYFKGLISERRVLKYSKGRPKIEWIKKSGARNEPFDLRNYASAALEILNPNLEALAKNKKNGNIYNQNAAKNANSIKKKRRTISKGVQ